MRILLADDSQDTRDLYTLAFMLARHAVRITSSGDEAIAAAQEEDFDVIVLDVMMPGTDGWQTLWHLRQLPQCQKIPIALFSAYTEDADISRARQDGADALLHKPLLPDELLGVLEDLIVQRAKDQSD